MQFISCSAIHHMFIASINGNILKQFMFLGKINAAEQAWIQHLTYHLIKLIKARVLAVLDSCLFLSSR